jgi:hypothetical protein
MSLIHRQNAGPTNKAIGAVGFDPYIGSEIPKRKSITIDGDAQGFAGEVIPARTLYNKLSATDKYAPRFVNGLIAQSNNSTNFVCDVPNALRAFLAVSDKVRFYDVSAETLSADSITIDAIGAEGSGHEGADYTLITCTGEVFNSAPASGTDLLVLSDGSEDDSDMVLVDEEVDLADSVDKVVSASYACTLKKSLINRADYINKADLAGREFYVANE